MLVKRGESGEGEQPVSSCWAGPRREREQERRAGGTEMLRQSGPEKPVEQLQEERPSRQVPG
jgi:hypothetical protein